MSDGTTTSCCPLPERLRLTGVSRAGPLPPHPAAVRVRAGTVALTGASPATLTGLSLATGPLRDGDGFDAPGQVVCTLLDDPPRVQVTAAGRLSPGSYQADLTIGSATLPVDLVIAAWWPWLLLAILLGVLLLGLSGFLSAEATLADRRARIFDLREALTLLTEHGDGSRQTAARAGAAAEALGAALAILAQPRPLALADTRVARADGLIASADAALATLREAAAGAAPGEAAVAELVVVWELAAARIDAVRARFGGARPTGGADAAPADDALQAALQTLERGLAGALVLPLADAMMDDLAAAVERVRLLAAAGAGDRAGQLARRTAERSEFLLAALLERADLVDSLRAQGAEAAGRAWLVQQGLADPVLPAATVAALRERLDLAITALTAEPTLARLQALHAAVQQAQTDLLAARAAAVLADTEHARTQMERETDISAIETLLAQGTPGDAPAVRRERVAAVIALWRQRVESFQGPRRASMAATLDQLSDAQAGWDIDALSAGFARLMADWEAYGTERFAALRSVPLEAFCDREAAAAALSLVANQRALDLSPPEPGLASLAEQLDGLGLRLARLSGGAGCLDELVAIGARTGAIGSTLFQASLLRSRLPPDQRLDAARRAGELETIALVERLLREPRPLTLVPRTPPAQRVEDRELVFDLAGLDPAWGSAVQIRVTFGDGTSATFDAASLAKAGVIAHRYVAPGQWVIAVTATLAAGADPGAPPLGQGGLTLRVDPSPANRAEALAASLLNLRTLLALAFALLIQGWRLAGRGPFGARAVDWLEAVAIGAGAQAGIDGLGALIGAAGTGGG